MSNLPPCEGENPSENQNSSDCSKLPYFTHLYKIFNILDTYTLCKKRELKNVRIKRVVDVDTSRNELLNGMCCPSLSRYRVLHVKFCTVEILRK